MDSLDYGRRVNDELVGNIKAELGRRGWSLRELSRQLGQEDNPQHVASRLKSAARSGGARRVPLQVADLIAIAHVFGHSALTMLKDARDAVGTDGTGTGAGPSVTPIRPRPDFSSFDEADEAARSEDQSKPTLGDE